MKAQRGFESLPLRQGRGGAVAETKVTVVQVWQYILLGVAVAVFFWAWQKGHLLRLGNYVEDTKVELKKCTWPAVDELKGSTMVVIVSISLVAIFTVSADFIISQFVRLLNNF